MYRNGPITLVAAVGRTKMPCLGRKRWNDKNLWGQSLKKLAYRLVISYIAIEHDCL